MSGLPHTLDILNLLKIYGNLKFNFKYQEIFLDHLKSQNMFFLEFNESWLSFYFLTKFVGLDLDKLLKLKFLRFRNLKWVSTVFDHSGK